MTNFEMDLFDTRMSYFKTDRDEEQCCSSSKNKIIKPACVPITIRIIQDGSAGLSKNADTKYLADHNLAEVRNLNFTRLFGSGVLHTKFIIADMKNVYVGSANMDWKSLTEVKELGLAFRSCSCVAADLYKIFAVYWRMGEPDSKIPPAWPISFRTQYNSRKPMKIDSDVMTEVFLSSSPEPFNPKGREFDLTAILDLIHSAKKSVSVSVMDMIPQTLYMKENIYWPKIDDALRDAAFRGVKVRLLISKWDHSRKQMFVFLKSLQDINTALPQGKNGTGSITVKVFQVPASEEQKKLPFARVNHNKYLITDEAVYIGTSNWSGDYFMTTAGVGVILRSGISGIWKDVNSIFERDWSSPYASDLN
ncbi:hypothetical protein WR25_11993 [Diploscapter pachys]|uniref:PLD phosphodiesterase domain-containing protein n=1 Tax=Diploscapter pachys TaxID=2018661 RepID=A0A2A2K6M5_9BILA|nr:hypothetical protein WR25_11993 [Diploscapter pachys]